MHAIDTEVHLQLHIHNFTHQRRSGNQDIKQQCKIGQSIYSLSSESLGSRGVCSLELCRVAHKTKLSS